MNERTKGRKLFYYCHDMLCFNDTPHECHNSNCPHTQPQGGDDTYDTQQLRKWGCKTFKSGCYLGDVARSKIELSENEWFALEMALEGYLAAGGILD